MLKHVPNALTTLRFLLVPVFVLVYYRVSATAGMVIYLLASMTDWLDGFIARRYNLITKWGKLMDPLADKVMLITALIVLVQSGRLHPFILAFMAVKEIVQIVAAALVLKRKDIVIPANWTGKTATVLFTIGIALSFFGDEGGLAGLIFILVGIIISVWAMVRYASIVVPQIFGNKPGEEEE